VVIAVGHTRVQSDYLVEEIIFCSNQTFLNALDYFFALNLVLQILLEDSFAMTLPVQLEVSSLFNVLLGNHPELPRHIVLMINIEYVRRLAE